MSDCTHLDAVPVESLVTGDVVAWLCPDCTRADPEPTRLQYVAVLATTALVAAALLGWPLAPAALVGAVLGLVFAS